MSCTPRRAFLHTRGLDSAHVRERIEAAGDEAVYFGKHAVFWGKFDEDLPEDRVPQAPPREDFFRQVTIPLRFDGQEDCGHAVWGLTGG